jgi:hypothetical protein
LCNKITYVDLLLGVYDPSPKFSKKERVKNAHF